MFEKIENIPSLVVKTLLFLEDRDLDQAVMPWQNPVIEWDRTVKAAMMYVGAKLNLPVPVQGGSTLAVQLEKFRHSPNVSVQNTFMHRRGAEYAEKNNFSTK